MNGTEVNSHQSIIALDVTARQNVLREIYTTILPLKSCRCNYTKTFISDNLL